MKSRVLFSFVLCFASLTGFAAGGHDTYQQLIDNPDHLSDTQRLGKLFAIDWERGVRQCPEFATDIGYSGLDDRWTDMSEAGIAKRQSETEWPLEVIKTINREALSPSDQLNYDLFRRNLELSLEGYKYPGDRLAVNQLGGVQQTIPQVITQMPHTTVKQYENILGRLRAAPALIDQSITLLQHGVATGVTAPKIILRNVPEQVRKVIPDDPMASALLKPFADYPDDISPADRDRLKAEAIDIYKKQIVPAYQKLHDYLVQEYIPKARDSIAWSALPNGENWYKLAVLQQTTTDLTPAEIHDLGLREVKRIHAQMEQVAASTGYKGSYESFLNYLRTDPRFYYTDPEALLAGYRNIGKQVDPVLPQYFGKLPRLPYGIRAIPAYAADSAPMAYYESGSRAAGRPGWFCANTSNLMSRPKWAMAALVLHESVPGHHLQLSLAQELENVPEFRKYDGYTAFAEGWALYCEHLGEEMGFYKDPYSRFGELTFGMWRACRLVIDTGIHSQGWTRRDKHEATVEVDRYIASPAQALAYKIGQFKFLELRDEATRELGDKFDLRAFHDALLANGSLPLPILDKQMKAWIESQKKAKP